MTSHTNVFIFTIYMWYIYCIINIVLYILYYIYICVTRINSTRKKNFSNFFHAASLIYLRIIFRSTFSSWKLHSRGDALSWMSSRRTSSLFLIMIFGFSSSKIQKKIFSCFSFTLNYLNIWMVLFDYFSISLQGIPTRLYWHVLSHPHFCFRR